MNKTGNVSSQYHNLRTALDVRTDVIRPKVTAHFAITWDGRISTRSRTPSDFSSKADKLKLLRVRAEMDAVLVGMGTVKADGMSLGLPDEDLRNGRIAAGRSAYPLRVIVSSSGAIDLSLPIFGSGVDAGRLVVFVGNGCSDSVVAGLRNLAKQGVDVWKDEEKSNALNLEWVLKVLVVQYGVKSIVCEGGGRLLGELAKGELLDEVRLTIVPRVFGGAEGYG